MRNVRIITDKKLPGFSDYDDGEFIKDYESDKTIEDALLEALETIGSGLKLEDLANEDREDMKDDYVCINLQDNGVNYTIDID